MKKPPMRFWIAVMIFFTTFTNYMLRANISVSIVEMVDRKEKAISPPCKPNATGPSKANTTKETTHNFEKYNWDEGSVGRILGAYFYGYLVSSLFGGVLAELLGPWHVILWSSLAGAVFTGLTPISAKLGAGGVIANRVIVGLLGGVAYPAVNVLIAKWAPPKEKGKFLGAMMGNTLGTVFAFNIVGLVTSAWGWPWGFYVLVICMVLYCVVFGIVVTDSPQKHRWISEEEKNHIFEMQEGHVSKKKHVAPFLKILLSIPFWMCVIAQFGNLWGLNLILTYAPKFMKETLGFNLKASAGLAALPNLARLFCSNIFGFIGDRMLKKEVMSKNKCRKFFILFSHVLPALCLLLMRAPGCNHVGVVVLLILNQGLNGAVVVSSLINPQDLSPNFAGTLYGTMNFVGMTTGFIVPEITGALNSYYKMGLTAATTIFTIGGIMMAAGGGVFVLFGSSMVQPWNDVKDEEEETTPTT